jgi:hypothetical protein
MHSHLAVFSLDVLIVVCFVINMSRKLDDLKLALIREKAEVILLLKQM